MKLTVLLAVVSQYIMVPDKGTKTDSLIQALRQ